MTGDEEEENGFELVPKKSKAIDDIEAGFLNQPQSSNETRHVQQYVMVNVASSITLTFINSIVFRYEVWAQIPVAFIAFQFAITGLGLYIGSRSKFGLFTAKFVNPLKMVPLSFSAVAVVVMTNLSLSYNSVAFCKMATVLTMPAVIMINLLLHREQVTSTAATALGTVCIGVALTCYGDIDTSVLGVLVALASVLVMASCQVFIGSKQVELDVSPAQLLLNHAPVVAGLLLIFVPFTDTLPRLLDIGFDAWLLLLLSGVGALFVNLSEFWIIGIVGPVAYNGKSCWI